MEEQAKKIAELLKLLANEQRLLILCALIPGPMTVGNIHAFTPNITGIRAVAALITAENGRNLGFRKTGDECHLSNCG